MKKLLYVFLCIVMICVCLSIVACETVTPQLRINADTNYWEVSYDNGATWKSLEVKATGENGQNGQNGANGSVVTIGQNGNWYIDGVDTGKSANCSCVTGDCDCGGSGSGSGGNDPIVPENPPTPGVYTPVMRFIVASDPHVRTNGALESQTRLEQLYDSAYEYVENDNLYDKLDGVFFCGDLTENGNDAQNTIFFNTVNDKTRTGTMTRAVLGNHDFRANGDNEENYPGGNINSDFNENSVTARRFKDDWAGYDADGHIVLGGYHFIFVSMDQYNYTQGYYFRANKREWLKGELDKAVADDPTGKKPIFVFQHTPPRNTVCGSFSAGGDINLHNLFKDYPNVVDFSGHSHQAQLNPDSIWQGDYTAVACGSMAYLSLHLYNDPSRTEDGSGFVTSGTGFVMQQNMKGAWADNTNENIRTGNMVWMCELDANGVLRLNCFDYVRGEVCGEPIILDTFDDPDEFNYRYDREITPDLPAFAQNAEVTVASNNYKKVDIAFPRVVGGHYVTNYIVDVLNSSDELLKTDFILSMDYFGNARPNAYSLSIGGLDPNTQYKINVYAMSYLKEKSLPITVNFTTSEAPTGNNVVPDVMSVQFNTDGTVKDTVTDKTLELVGSSATPTIALDETLGKNVATFAKGSKYGTVGYKFYDFVDWAPVLAKEFTMEINVYPTAVPPDASPFRPLSWIESGGFGFSFMRNNNSTAPNTIGTMRFYYYTSISAKVGVLIDCAKNEWTHVVVTFDGSYLRMYKNGVLAATSEEITKPMYLANADYIGIGCDASVDGVIQQGFPGKMTTANIYSSCLTDAQVATIYAPFAPSTDPVE